MNKQIIVMGVFAILIFALPRVIFPRFHKLGLNGTISYVNDTTLIGINVTNNGPDSVNTTVVVFLGSFLSPIDYQKIHIGYLKKNETRNVITELYSPKDKILFPLKLIISAYSDTHIANPFIPRMFTVIVK